MFCAGDETGAAGVSFSTHGLHDAQAMRHADADQLSLALIAARNQTLRWLSLFESAGDVAAPTPHAHFEPARWLAGHAGWWQERWIARNVQRSRGAQGDATRAPLASIEPDADRWWDPLACPPDQRWSLLLPDFEATRAYMVDTLETTLELLAAAAADDTSLHHFRAALQAEDALVERFAALAQAQQLQAALALVPARVQRVAREPLCWGAQRWSLGSPLGGYVPANEQWAHDEAVPEFEIDAQAVSWAEYAEFVEDGGYDDMRWWHADGWAWVQATQRRSPRDVEQLRHGVLLRRFGQLQRAPATQAATHVSWYEADAWCRWAGRRLPTEVEWELAAVQGASRGFAWLDLAEWTAGRARAWPGGAPVDTALRVQRGVPWLAPARLAHPKARRFLAVDREEGFVGFRSCGL